MRRIMPARWLLLLLSSALLAGCNTGVKFGYTQLDWLLPLWMERQVSLDSAQAAQLRRHTRQFIDWHCSAELPIYADWLEAVAEQARYDMTEAQVTALYDQVEAARWRILENLVDPLAQLAAGLTDAQAGELLAAVDTQNHEYFTEYLEGDDRQRRVRYARWMGGVLERRIGPLNDDQRARIGTWADGIDLMTQELRTARQAWRDRLADILTQRYDAVALRGGVRELLLDWPSASDAEFARRYDRNTRHALRLLADLSSSLTVDQQRQLDKRNSGLARTLRSIDCPNPPGDRAGFADRFEPKTAAGDIVLGLRVQYRFMAVHPTAFTTKI